MSNYIITRGKPDNFHLYTKNVIFGLNYEIQNIILKQGEKSGPIYTFFSEKFLHIYLPRQDVLINYKVFVNLKSYHHVKNVYGDK